jgi:tetratricopeptide (TPR) repeat protein
MTRPAPILALEHEWHRQRATLRIGSGTRGGSQLRPPPLVAAGLEIEHDPQVGRSVRVGGLVVIFGHFPATLADFIVLAKARLHLQPEQARELDPVLNTRVMALWAWLPTQRRDCYLELDRATGALSAWLLGPGPGDIEALDPEADTTEIDHWFLSGLVLNGHAHWGGERGLNRLIERFGSTALLTAALVADRLEHQAEDPEFALAAAQVRWPKLSDEDELPWATLAEQADDADAEPGDDAGHPFVRSQLGRLALRLGLLRAARALLASSSGAADVSPIAWFDLGQACEALDDLSGAESSFMRYAAARPQDPDAWRRLLFCRIKRERLQLAEECLRKYHGSGGKDDELVERYLHVVARGRVRSDQRAWLAGFLIPRLGEAFIRAGQSGDVAREIVRLRFTEDESSALAFTTLSDRLHDQITAGLRAAGVDQPEDLADAVLRVALLTLPFLGSLHLDDDAADAEFLADAVQQAVDLWAEDPWVARQLAGPAPRVDGRPLLALAAMAIAVWLDDQESA